MRSWGARGLLHFWDDGATNAVVSGLADEHYRPAEMCLKVAARHEVAGTGDGAAILLHHGLPRVRIQALRCLAVMGDSALPAQSLVPVPPTAVGRLAAVTMMDDQPLILGLLQPLTPEVVADGETLVLEANRELTLRCGAASITMTADGRVTIRGTQLLSRSDGANRVQGATVQLN
ncbi:MAG: hypothetical protein EON94_13385 [Caulobacteraceae bacterium]|nr:MAG: hypothetical protein EON94_13385 [Caulobacteraceae bacterium]